jgi:hypothetical protein
MSTRSYVGVHHADTATVSVRYVHSDGTPGYMVPALRAIWRDTFAGDTAAMAAALLANSWDYLGVDVTAATTSPFGDERPVAGVGMTMGVDLHDQTLTIAMSSIARSTSAGCTSSTPPTRAAQPSPYGAPATASNPSPGIR